MNTKPTIARPFLLVIAAFVMGVIFYIKIPTAEIATHWNVSGEADGDMGKFWGVFLLPIISFVLFILYWIIPKIDPLKGNIEQFRTYYNTFWFSLFLFILYIYGLQMAWNLGARFHFGLAIIPAMAVLWYVAGVMVEHSKPNWFVGIRTPWTLSSDVVWDKTHKLGGRLFKLLSFTTLVSLLLRENAIVIALVAPAIAVVCITVIYSYIEYRKLKLK